MGGVFGLGVVAAALGIFIAIGSSKIVEAPESGRALESISNDLKEQKTYFIGKIEPYVIETLVKAILTCLSVVLVCTKIASENSNFCHTGGAPCTILLLDVHAYMALVLTLHLFGESAWLSKAPLIFIIPCIAILGMFLQQLLANFKAIWKFTMRITYWIFGLPYDLFWSPASNGYIYYANSSILLSTIVNTITLLLYSFARLSLINCIEYFVERKISLYRTVLASYIIFVVTALVVYGIWSILHRFCMISGPFGHTQPRETIERD